MSNDSLVESNSKRKRSLEYEIQKACLDGNTEKAIDYLNKSEALDIDELNRLKVLCDAIESEDVALVKRLLEIGCNAKIMNEIKQTPLHLASEEGNFQIINLLLDFNAESNAEDIFQETALHKALRNGHFSIVDLLVTKAALPIESKIHKACIEGNVEVALTLLNKGIPVNVDEINQNKTLIEAVISQNVTIVRELLKLNVDVNIQDKDGQTPLHEAAGRGSITIIEELLKHSAKVNLLDSYGESALYEAIWSQMYQIAELLIKHGAKYHG